MDTTTHAMLEKRGLEVEKETRAEVIVFIILKHWSSNFFFKMESMPMIVRTS